MVYFHPARSKGAMILATQFCIILAGFAAILCSLSILTLYFFDNIYPERNDFEEQLGGWVTLVVYIGGGMGVLAWSKQYVNNPSYNTGES